MCRGRRAYTTGKDSPAREPSWSAIWLQKPCILCEGGGRGGERGGRAFYYTGVVPDFSVIQFNVAANLCLSLNFVTVSETPSTDRLSFFKR